MDKNIKIIILITRTIHFHNIMIDNELFVFLYKRSLNESCSKYLIYFNNYHIKDFVHKNELYLYFDTFNICSYI